MEVKIRPVVYCSDVFPTRTPQEISPKFPQMAISFVEDVDVSLETLIET